MLDSKLRNEGLPRVSIGMPVYNGKQFIRRALDSLLAQTFTDFELIVSDNCSTDGTWELLKEYAEKDTRIILHRQDTNKGMTHNFLYVLSLAKCRYFMWAAVDDNWMPEFIDVMHKELERHADAGVAMCAVERRYEDGSFMDIIRFEGKKNPHNRTYYGMMKAVISPIKYNLYMYGLYRTGLLREAMKNHAEVPGGDRLLMCQFALATRFRYVNSIYHIRTNHRLPSHVRLPEERVNKMTREERWLDITILQSLCGMLFKSEIIPTRRKLYIPVALFRYSVRLVLPKILSYIEMHVSDRTYNQLKTLKRILR